MRRYLLSTIFFLTLPVLPVSAQNYIPSNGYSGAGVVVNMDVLSGSRPASPFGITPTLSQPLPPLRAPMRAPVRAPGSAPVAMRPPAPKAAPAPMPAPKPAETPAVARKYTSPLAAIDETPVEPIISKPVLEPISREEAPKLAAAPAPIGDLIKDDEPVSGKSSGNGRQELASFHEPISDDIIDFSDAKTDSSSISSINEMPDAPKPVAKLAPMPEPVDEMAPELASTPPALPPSLPAVEPKALEPFSPPPIPSPTADRPGKKGGVQVAMATPAAPVASAPDKVISADNAEAYRLLFDGNSPELKPSETAILDKVAARLNNSSDLRLQVRSYANGTPETTSAARRLSLARALKVREYLMQKNIVATRLDIRALGSGSVEMGDEVGRGQAPADRVDLVFAQ